jgi:HPt (histidine-containing phosphotransfer) domain-containing protein
VTPPPNPPLVELAAIVGEENARHLVRTFLRDFPAALNELAGAERKTRHRLIHSMKSSARVVGAVDFSQKLAGLEARLADMSLPDLTSAEIQSLVADFGPIAGPLREFVGA